MNKGLEDVADLGRELERQAIKAGYGSTVNPASVQKLVDAIVDYQVESKKMIEDLRKESDESSKEIAKIVEDGKKRHQEAVLSYQKTAQKKYDKGGFDLIKRPVESKNPLAIREISTERETNYNCK